MLESGYSRIPVYDGSIDNVIGIFMQKNLSGEYIKNFDEWNDFDIRTFYMNLRLL